MLSRHKGPHIEIILNGGLGNQLLGGVRGLPSRQETITP